MRRFSNIMGRRCLTVASFTSSPSTTTFAVHAVVFFFLHGCTNSWNETNIASQWYLFGEQRKIYCPFKMKSKKQEDKLKDMKFSFRWTQSHTKWKLMRSIIFYIVYIYFCGRWRNREQWTSVLNEVRGRGWDVENRNKIVHHQKIVHRWGKMRFFCLSFYRRFSCVSVEKWKILQWMPYTVAIIHFYFSIEFSFLLTLSLAAIY